MEMIQVEVPPVQETAADSALAPFFREICIAYGLMYNYTNDKFHLSSLGEYRKTFQNLAKVLLSTRTPYTVMSLASEIGMYIPASKRYGLTAFEFYLNNLKYYDSVLLIKELPSAGIPSLNDLLSLPDNAILKERFMYTVGYSDRLAMLKRFLKDNFTEWFELPSNSRTMYNTKNASIFYKWVDSDKTEKMEIFTTDDLLALLSGPDLSFISRYTRQRRQFSPLALLDLRTKIIEKICKWRIREANTEFGSARLYKIYQRLDKILESTCRVSAQSHFQYYLINFNPL